jgi:tellurite resistance protein
LLKLCDNASAPEELALEAKTIQASAFGIVLGVYGLGRGWSAAATVWHLPPAIGTGIIAGADLIWVLLIALYAQKWLRSRSLAIEELRHPIRSCYVDLVFSSTLLVSISILPHASRAAWVLASAGWAGHCLFTVWRAGLLWQGARRQDDNTPVLFLPQVTGNFISAFTAATFGCADLAALFFGAGALSWIPIEAVVVGRLFTHELPAALRPSLGIRLSPPATACVAYLTIRQGVPDFLVMCLLGYGLLQAALLFRLNGWIRAQKFALSYWGFSFGLAALGWSTLSVVRLQTSGAMVAVALPLFIVENLMIGAFLIYTSKLLMGGRALVPADQKNATPAQRRIFERAP